MSVSTPNCQGVRRNQKLSSLSSSGKTNGWPQRSSTSGIASHLHSYVYNIKVLNMRYNYWLCAIASCTCCLLKLNLFNDWVMVHEHVQSCKEEILHKFNIKLVQYMQLYINVPLYSCNATMFRTTATCVASSPGSLRLSVLLWGSWGTYVCSRCVCVIVQWWSIHATSWWYVLLPVYCFMMYRAQLEKQMVSAGSRSESTPTNSTHLEAAGRISQLEDKLERANNTCKDLQNQVHVVLSVFSPVCLKYLDLRAFDEQFQALWSWSRWSLKALVCILTPHPLGTLGRTRTLLLLAILLVGENRENSYPCIKHDSCFTNLIFVVQYWPTCEDLDMHQDSSVTCIIQFLLSGEAAEAL